MHNKVAIDFYSQEFIENFKDKANALQKIPVDINNPKIDVKSIAEHLGLSFDYSLLDKSGELDKDVIKVNSFDPEVRQRFTIAHEIGHFILHEPEQAVSRDDIENYSSVMERIQEREANQFAAELLMPKKLLIKVINDYMSEKKLESHLDPIQFEIMLDNISRKLDVSKSSLEFRLKNLKIIREPA